MDFIKAQSFLRRYRKGEGGESDGSDGDIDQSDIDESSEES